jgi:DNA-binding MarR family transcriptional regulator
MDIDLSGMFRLLVWEHRTQLQNFLKKYNIYLGQHRVLFSLQSNPKVTLTQLALDLNVSKESLSVSLKRLEKSGLIRRDIDEKDRRRYVLSLSQEGEQVSDACRLGFNDINERMFASLSEGEKAKMLDMFERMLDDMRGESV